MDGSLAYREEWLEELVAGEILALAAPSVNHNLIAANLARIFGNYLLGKSCTPFGDNTMVFLTEEDHFIPDAMIVCDPEMIRPEGIFGAPDLVVEILSPSTADYDKRYKKDVYEKCGVREYWIISPGERSIDQYVNRNGFFELAGVYSLYPDWALAGMSPERRAGIPKEIPCSLFDDFRVEIADVFYRVR